MEQSEGNFVKSEGNSQRDTPQLIDAIRQRTGQSYGDVDTLLAAYDALQASLFTVRNNWQAEKVWRERLEAELFVAQQDLAALRGQLQQTGWQSIETAPKDEPVLLWTPIENLYLPPFTPTMEPLLRVSTTRHWTWATHWRPLPDPPGVSSTPAPEQHEDDEEEVRHAFTSRTPYEPGDDRDIWCRDCEYHRDHPIHQGNLPPSHRNEG